ncbi:hypothetical protein LWI29_032939 [Acer saccharum]|uniref:Ubiquitin-like protease family profile domain-containing protein n=1 Tax=Acer saccharum TaxID=4024 RepID=A0AA39SIN4_ACESA|nr:hypothetical protein LWI29_032939 [Acer saccharum]
MQTASGSGGPMAIDERATTENEQATATTENEQATATTERERAAAENDQAMASHSGGEEVAGRATAEKDQVTASLSGGEEVAGRATAENDQATASLSGGEEVAGQMENIDYEQFLKVKRNKWNEESLINVGCRLKNIATIEKIIRKEGKHKEFMSSCFKQFTNFPQKSLFSATVVHGVLLREIRIEGATENELFISFGGKKARFGCREFCLVTGLRFGELSEIINTPYVANANGIHKRYWPGQEGEDLKLSTVYQRFLKRKFKDPDDSLKMGLFLIANNVLFGQPLDKKVTNWLFNLVDDLDAFNSFAWGHYVFKMTMHYLRHGFRPRNSKKGHGKVRYRLYGFPWAVELWAMEAVGTLINGFGLRLQHTLPRMRCWAMKKRPRNGVQIISKIEANIRAGKAQVLEELKPTDDEVGADYWVGVDFDMSMGPQFIPLVEMKEKNELLDDGDDGDDGGDGDGDGVDGSDGGDGDGGEVGEGGDRDDVGDRGIGGQKKKRKAPKQKKKASAKKQQRETVPITRLAEQDPLPTPSSLGYTRTQLDDPLSVGFTQGYSPTLPEGMVHTPYPPRSSFMQPPPHMSSRQEPRSRDGDRINELLDAVKALPDLMKDIVKGEVSQLPGVLKGLMQEKQSTRGQNNNEAPSTDVRDPSSHIEQAVDAQAVDANVSIEQEVSPSSRQKEVDEEGLVSGDLTHIDAYMSLLAKRMESDPDEYRHSFVLLSSEFYTKVKVEWNRIIEADNEAGSSFDALEYECPEDWIEYGRGNRPGWGRPWWLYTQLLIPCCVGEPDGHWILCKVNLLDRHIGIFDPTASKKSKKNPFERFRQVMPLRRLLPSIMNRCGFYSSRSEKPRGSMFTVGVSSNPKIPQQVDDCSCGVFIAKYAETAIVKKADWNWGQKEMADYRKELAFQIYINSVVFKSPMQQ